MIRNDNIRILKKSNYIKEFSFDNIIVLYHTFSQEIIIGNSVLKELISKFRTYIEVNKLLETYSKKDKNSIEKVINELYNQTFLIERSFDDQVAKKFQARLPQSPEFSYMYLILTEKCNLNCKYCFIKKNALKGQNNLMSIETAKKGIDFFIKNSSKDAEKHHIVLYGGEPLLNFENVEYSITYLKDRYSQKPGIKLDIDLVTNGTLITESIAKFLYENRINVTVSVDGVQETHDLARVYTSGKGTFNDTLKGYNLLKDAGCNTNISCTIGEHNFEKLDRITNYIITVLHPETIHFNIIWEEINGSILKITEKIIKSFEMGLNNQVRIEPIMTKTKAFINKQFRFYNCAACGKQIVISPNGDVGPCYAFLNTKEFFKGNIYDSNYNPLTDPIFNEWNKYSPLNIKKCLTCPAIAICGGGCLHNNYLFMKDILIPDPRECVFNKELLKWMIQRMNKELP
jgi:uncharacterized protein